jgi:K(+)-stimulated pyrophosphate-energized sodium pump
MYSATKANVRTAVAARDQGSSEALNIAFFGGSIMGLTVAAMGLFGVGILFYFFAGNIDTIHAIEGFAMGASSVALFSRVGGGIFTKSADVGADLVGKVEAGIQKMTQEIQELSQIMSEITWVMWQVWVLIFLNLIVVQ